MSQEFFILKDVTSQHTFEGHFLLIVRDYTQQVLEQLGLFIFAYILLCISCYVGIVKWKIPKFNKELKAKRVLIVTAHPDDECMFFGPTVLNLLTTNDADIRILCLSTGSNYGMGKIRKTELFKACNVLGISSDNITVRSHSLMPDVIDAVWPVELVQKIILNEIEMYDIDTVITFDKWGISGHANHSSIFYSVANLCLEESLPKNCAIYVLETVNILRKYILFFDIPLSLVLSRTRYFINFSDRKLIHQAMKQHRSQLVWFRWLYMYFSRYMLINTLYKLDVVDIHFDVDLEL